MTVLGGIGNFFSGLCYTLGDSTNTANFVEWMKHLRTHCKAKDKVYLIMDNASAHRSWSALQVMDELNIIPEFLPVKACNYNSIESMWSILKQRFVNDMPYFDQQKLDQTWLLDRVEQLLDDMNAS